MPQNDEIILKSGHKPAGFSLIKFKVAEKGDVVVELKREISKEKYKRDDYDIARMIILDTDSFISAAISAD